MSPPPGLVMDGSVPPSELQAKHELKMSALRDELELRRKTEIHEIEEVR